MDSCRPKRFVKVKPTRELDVCYDATLTFPTSKDYEREISKAVEITTTYAIHPKYDTMFSDTRLRNRIVPISSSLSFVPQRNFNETVIVPFSEKAAPEALGPRRPLYFKQPLTKPKVVPKEDDAPAESTLENLLKDYRTPRRKSSLISKDTQTDFRDSETQTGPWAHDVVAKKGTRLLELNWLQIGKSANWQNVESIKRSWQRQAWNALLPSLRAVHPKQLAAITIGLIENDSSLSEHGIDEVNNERMELSESYLSRDLANGRRKLCERLQRRTTLFQENSGEKLSYMKHQLVRCLRKLDMTHRKIPRKYKPRGILEELSDKASELYAPQLKFGENPARRNEVIQWEFIQPFAGLEILEKRVTQSVKPPPALKRNLNSQKPSGMCNRAIKLCEKGLEDLYMDLKAIWVNNKERDDPKLRSFVQAREKDQEETPTLPEMMNSFEDDELKWLLLKKIIEGRSVQTQTLSQCLLPEDEEDS